MLYPLPAAHASHADQEPDRPVWSVRDAVCEAAGAMRRSARRRIACARSVGRQSAAFEAKECKHQTVLN
ncbi:TPA: hypothetical protein QDB15_003924 [Burkholderia vietnamiensis]|uniref:hypothetical protein n=1 Tax=Burkholderia vietnamiensis TaxID=60552 RepID=UPI001593262A|nr:hypothetical protein [Burkholderia vietnamiensis]HDR9120109.1 hypothetical protein [Burkholderia vietnamiensis]HDR9283717.1 hypothetical protein [Burkholderia vietnamiensis]